MTGIRFNHVAFRVSDMDASVRFLRALLGDAVRTVDLLGNSGADGRRIVLVETAGGVLLDLVSAGGIGPEKGPEYGMTHYCFGVEDVDLAFAAALEGGGTEKMAPSDFTSSAHPGVSIRVAFVTDPNGDVCELIEHDWLDRAELVFRKVDD